MRPASRSSALSAEWETIRCAAVLFDLDGVLVDSGAAVERAWERWAGRHRLPEGTWAVATSGTRRLATSRLAHGRLPLPAVLVTAEDVERGKPDPQPYLRAAEKLGVEPSQCLVV